MPFKRINWLLVFGVWCLVSGVWCLACAYELPRYEINAKIDTAAHSISAKQKVTFTNNSDKEISEIYFHIYPHRRYSEKEKRFLARYAAYFNINPYPEGFQSGDLRVNSVTYEGQNLFYALEGEDETILKVELAQKLAPGAYVVTDLDFTVDIPHAYGRFGWHKSASGVNIISLLRWYPILSVLDADGWHNYPFYPYHQPYFSEAADYLVYLTLPQDIMAVHSGLTEDEIDSPDGTKTLLIKSELPLRDFGLVLSPDYKVLSGEAGNVKVNSYYLEGGVVSAQKALDAASELIGAYSSELTPYPYREFNIAPSFLGYGGTQSSNLILIDTRAYKLPGFLDRYFEFLVVHETGHQWFYNLVGSDEYKEMFIDEGINSYFALRYLNSKYGPEAEVMVLPKGLKWLAPNFSFERAQLDRYSFVAKNGIDRPVLGKLSSFQEPSSIFSITYGKGSKIVDMLEFVMGQAAFKRLIQRYFKEFSFRNISAAQLRGLASEEAGRDLGWFFDAWLNGTLTCDYAVSNVEKNKVVLENRGAIQMPVDIEVLLEDGTTRDYKWDDNEKQKIIEIAGPPVSSASIDPKKRLLDLDRTNNNWKRRIDFRPVAFYYPVYEVPVFLKDDAYSLVAGPQLGGSDFGIRASLQKPEDNILYVSSAYNFNEERIKNTLGFEQKHLGGKLLKWGLEVFDYNDIDASDDQEGFKLYLRQELWPASYGLLDENDHVTLYLLRNRDFKGALTSGGLEQVRNLHYRQQDEAIWGLNLKFGRYGTYPDPGVGWKFKATLENAEHFLGGEDYFWRMSPELSRYFTVGGKDKIAARVKTGLGYPADKGLFQLGGESGLRGYPYKTINGSQAVMFNSEYRLSFWDGLNLSSWDNLVSLKKVQGVAFFDIGKAWFRSFGDSDFKKDAGLGLRLRFDVIGFLERVIIRVDVAQAINEPKEPPRVWLGASHSF